MNINFTFSCIIKKVYTANRIFFVVVLTCFYFEFSRYCMGFFNDEGREDLNTTYNGPS